MLLREQDNSTYVQLVRTNTTAQRLGELSGVWKELEQGVTMAGTSPMRMKPIDAWYQKLVEETLKDNPDIVCLHLLQTRRKVMARSRAIISLQQHLALVKVGRSLSDSMGNRKMDEAFDAVLYSIANEQGLPLMVTQAAEDAIGLHRQEDPQAAKQASKACRGLTRALSQIDFETD